MIVTNEITHSARLPLSLWTSIIFSATMTPCSTVQKPMMEPARGYVFLFPWVTPMPPPIETLKPASSPCSSTMAMKPTSLAKTSTSLFGGIATATLNYGRIRGSPKAGSKDIPCEEGRTARREAQRPSMHLQQRVSCPARSRGMPWYEAEDSQRPFSRSRRLDGAASITKARWKR